VTLTVSPTASRRWLFGEPDFRRLWLVGLVVFSVRWLEMLAVAVFVYQRTASPLIVALLTMLRMLPMALFGALIGAAAERVERRTALVLVVALMLLCSIVLALLAWSNAIQVWQLALASFISGLTWTTDNPVRRTMIGEVVGPERMSAAMSIDVGANNASRMLGPTVGGILLATLGIGGAFAVSVAGYLVAAIVALRVRHRNTAALSTAAGVLERMIEGLVLVRRDPRLSGTMVITVIYNTFGWPFTSMIPVIGHDNLGLGAAGIGLLASMDGVGAFCGAIVIPLYAKPPHFARRGRDISRIAAGLCAGARSSPRGLRATADGARQFRLQHHAGNARLSCGAARDARPRLWRALRLYRGRHDRFPPSWLARRHDWCHLGDNDDRGPGPRGVAADPAVVARGRTVTMEIVAATATLDVS